ncbi:Short-chain dehydrogenase/reductase [Lachnellula occidentalis]|uniref:Short-chain dehydrogenase/reductase n=1 Tax=Lachnellula occidentalis TaxID=215460 RepID=A0A8H8UHV9_9HELO|nr:Short-chain dehydrogenase/reductase [Lachnellula occidentalis]
MSTSVASKIVLITGANQGIGFAIAKTLSSKPAYHVLMGSRDAQRGIDAAKKLQGQGLHVEPITIDVTSDESIAKATQQVMKQFGRLDVLINNAGVSLKEDGISGLELRNIYQETFAVNTFGAALTTESFIPLLKSSPTPRIVFMSTVVSSLANEQKFPAFLPVYRSSKSALNMLMMHYASMYKDAGWKVNASCPGYCATNLNAFAGMDTPDNGALNAVRLATLGEDGETGTFSNKDGVIAW